MTTAKTGAVQSVVNAGTVVGNLFVSWWFIEYFGRKKTFTIGTFIVLVGIALQAGAVAYGMIIAGRIIAGIGTAVIGTNLAGRCKRLYYCYSLSSKNFLLAYLSEVATTDIRGRMVSFVQISYQVGSLIAYCVGLGTVKISGNNSWRTATAVQLPVGVFLIVASWFIPESPRWRLEKYPTEPHRALHDLSRIRCLAVTDQAIQEEFQEMITAHEYYKSLGKVTWKSFFSSYAVWKRIAYGMSTMASKYITFC